MCADACATVVRPDSIGWRRDSPVCLGNSGSSSRNSTPRCARLTSPGRASLPAASLRRLRRGMVRLAIGRAQQQQPPARQHAGDTVDPAGLQHLPGVRGRAAGRAAAPPPSTCRNRGDRSSAGCVPRQRRSPRHAWRIPSLHIGKVRHAGRFGDARSGGVSTCVPRKRSISDSRSAAASTSMRPAQAAPPPWLDGHIRPRSWVDVPIAAGSMPARGFRLPSSDSSPRAA